jgi:hypothetical protein
VLCTEAGLDEAVLDEAGVAEAGVAEDSLLPLTLSTAELSVFWTPSWASSILAFAADVTLAAAWDTFSWRGSTRFTYASPCLGCAVPPLLRR